MNLIAHKHLVIAAPSSGLCPDWIQRTALIQKHHDPSHQLMKTFYIRHQLCAGPALVTSMYMALLKLSNEGLSKHA